MPRLPRPQNFTAEVVDKTWHTPDTLELSFKPAEPVTWLPGQYISLRLPDIEGEKKGAMRAYSIWSHPSQDGLLRTVVKIIPDGRASTLYKNVSVGADLEFLGPLGMFILRDPLPKNLYFVGTGTGIVPLRAMLLELIQAGEMAGRQVHFLMGVRNQVDRFAVEELTGLAAQHEGLHFHEYLSRPSEGWTGHHGRLTMAFEDASVLPAPGEAQFYLCGNGAMVKQVKSLLKGHGFDRKAIITEKYFD